MKTAILVKPKFTEKSLDRTSKGVYTFVIAKNANKIEVAKEIQKKFKVKAVKVNIISRVGKKKRFGKIYGNRKNEKLAIVYLAKDQKIKELDVLIQAENKPESKEKAGKQETPQSKITVRKRNEKA